jgi:hypothetical protein
VWPFFGGMATSGAIFPVDTIRKNAQADLCDFLPRGRIPRGMTENAILREQLVQVLRGGAAHVGFLSALKDFPAEHYGTKPHNSAHSAWEVLEHIRIALHDLYEFSTSDKYVELKWPEGYWPKSSAPATPNEWHSSVGAIEEDLEAFSSLVKDPHSNLFAPIPWGTSKDQTLLREALLAATHTSYHIGEFVLLRRLVGAWKG